jgi:hypothetical protein
MSEFMDASAAGAECPVEEDTEEGAAERARPDIRFYDNETDNWQYYKKKDGTLVKDMSRHSDYIRFIPVNNDIPNENIRDVSISSATNENETLKKRELNQAYINKFKRENNNYALFLDEAINDLNAKINHIENDQFSYKNDKDKTAAKKLVNDELTKIIGKDYPSDGVELLIPDLLAWSRPTASGQTKIVIFDWDKTITAVEGMYFGSCEERSILDLPIDQIELFVMGGKRRLDIIKSAIERLLVNNVKIFIITNNQNASRDEEKRSSRSIYLQLIMSIFNKDEAYANSILYCAKDHGCRKSLAACAIEMLNPLLNCGDTTPSILEKRKGGTRLKTRRTRRRRRTRKTRRTKRTRTRKTRRQRHKTKKY